MNIFRPSHLENYNNSILNCKVCNQLGIYYQIASIFSSNTMRILEQLVEKKKRQVEQRDVENKSINNKILFSRNNGTISYQRGSHIHVLVDLRLLQQHWLHINILIAGKYICNTLHGKLQQSSKF